MNPALFPKLGIPYNDLSLFNKLGAYGVKLDLVFSGIKETQISRNPYGIRIDNNLYTQYKGEAQIALQDMGNLGSVNVVGHIDPDDLLYLDSIKPNSDFS